MQQDNTTHNSSALHTPKAPISSQSSWKHHVGDNPIRSAPNIYQDDLQISIGNVLLHEKLKIHIMILTGIILIFLVVLMEFTALPELRKLYVDPTKPLAFMSWKVILLSSSSLFLAIMTILQTFYGFVLLQRYKKEQFRERNVWEMYFLFLCDAVILFVFLLFPLLLFFLPILSVILPQE